MISCRNGGNHILSNWKILVLGQAFSLMVACSLGFAATLVFECSLSAPAAMLGFNYLLQSFHLLHHACFQQSSHPSSPTQTLTGKNDNKKSDDNNNSNVNDGESSGKESALVSSGDHIHKGSETSTYYLSCGSKTKKIAIHMSVWMYLLAAFLHFEGNYFNFLALRYTTMTSVSLIDGCAIPSALIFSRILLHKKYRRIHIIGVTLCFIGILTNFGADVHKLHRMTPQEHQDGETSRWPHLVRGDVMALISTLFCGLSDVLNEVILKRYKAPSNEYLGMIGLFATFLAFFQAIIIERQDISNFLSPISRIRAASEESEIVIGEDFSEGSRSCPQSNGLLLLGGFVMATYASYVIMCRFLLISEAALLNLSLITADFWSVGFVIVMENIKPEPLFFFSLCFTVVGLLIYQSGPTPAEKDEYERNNPPTFHVDKDKTLEIT